ncbi:MAG: Hsp20/alpha crystallin family protein [Gemmatimonadota bacterium]|nr:MAG: Hsp20/alpha crystallin family protein [Gemmatimonadota bacterium]
MMYPTLWRARRDPAVADWLGSRREIDRLFDGFFFGPATEAVSGSTWAPVMDVHEDEDGVTVTTELPGLSSDDVKVLVENGVLSISGEKKREFEEGKEDGDYHLVERRYGRFQRSFRLPRSVDADKVTAKFESGVLRVVLPKSEKAKPRLIAVR